MAGRQRPEGRTTVAASTSGRAVAGGFGSGSTDRQVSYGLYETEDEAVRAQARWRLTHLLPADDPEVAEELPVSVAD